jgi:DNA-binding MarR family transcriptional regulator
MARHTPHFAAGMAGFSAARVRRWVKVSQDRVSMSKKQTPNGENVHGATKVRRSVTHLARRLRGLRSDHGISGSKLAILGWLFRQGTPMTATDLARLERLQPQSLTRIIAELDEQGLIRRTPDATDGRQILIEISQAGKDLLVVDAHRQNQWLMEVMAATMTKAEREILVIAADLLDKLASEPTEPDPLKRKENLDKRERISARGTTLE